MTFSEKKIISITKWLRRYYVFTVVLGIILIIPAILVRLELFLNVIVYILVGFGIAHGLKQKKAWIVPVMVLLSTYSLITSIFLSQPNGILELIIKVAKIVLAIFELYFFTRKEVKRYFNSKGIWLF